MLELADVAPVAVDDAYDGPAEVAADELGPAGATCAPGAAASWRGPSAAPSSPRSAPIRPTAPLRELLALQSSDWAFLIDRGTAGDYPRERAEAHYQSFISALAGESSDELRNLAPELANWAFVQP